MDARFARVDALFQLARRLPANERAAALARECGDDQALKAEVEALLTALDATPDREPSLSVSGLVKEAWPADAPPDDFCGFRILRRLAAGGMGVVYEAEQAHPRRRVAVKVLHPGAASDEGRMRFGREAEILARLHHPGIAQVYVFGSAPTAMGDSPFLAMELVDGKPLNEHARALDLRARLELLAKVCDAVAHAHANGVIHRDLKPSNILVTAAGEPKVLDFGVARLADADSALRTRTGQVIGTLAYMSPEQATGDIDRVDTRSDVYSLGVLGYEMFCGRLPHEIGSGALADAIRRIVEQDPPAPSSLDRRLRGDVSLILRMALAKEPGRRYAGAAALAEDIRRYLRNEPIVARPPTATYQLRKFVRRHRAFVGGVAATIVALVVGLVLAVRAAQEEERQRRRADRSAADARWATSKALMEAASSDLRASAGQAARGRLERVAPEHRAWEWRYLAAQVDASSRFVPIDWQPEAIVFDAEARSAAFLEGKGPGLAHAQTGARAAVDAPELKWRCLSRLGPGFVALGTKGKTVSWTRLGSGIVHQADIGTIVKCAAGTRDGSRIALCMYGNLDYSRIYVFDAASGDQVMRAVGDVVEMTEIAFSPDGRHLAAAGFALDIHVLDTATGTEVGLLHGHTGRIGVLAYSPDGNLLASGADDKAAIVWRVSDRAIVHRWVAHEGEIKSLAWSPDGARIASGDALGTIRIWDLATGECQRMLQGHEQLVGALAFRDDRTLLSAGSDGIREWDVTPGRDPNVLRHHKQGNRFPYVYTVAFSPDGSLLASGGWDNTVRIGDAATNELLATLRHPDRVEDARFSPDGRTLTATMAGGAAVEWDVGTATKLRDVPKIKVPRGTNPAYSPDGRLMAFVPANGVCHVKTVPGGELVHEIKAHEGGVTGVAFDATGQRFATGGLDRIVRVWDTRSGRKLLELQGHRERIYALAFHPDGKLLASGANDNTIRLWDLERGVERIELRGHENYVHGLSFSPDGTTLASASGDNTVRLWSTLTLCERKSRADAELAARAAVAPNVEDMFVRLGDARAVADAIRADATLDDARRRAALHLVLLRSGEKR